MSKNYGAEWLKDVVGAGNVSQFGEVVANILDDAFAGIYHLKQGSLTKADWKSDKWIQISVFGELSTVDSDRLTKLVVLCHDRVVRLEISGASSQYIRLGFSPRQREGNTYERHPTMEAAIENIRLAYRE